MHGEERNGKWYEELERVNIWFDFQIVCENEEKEKRVKEYVQERNKKKAFYAQKHIDRSKFLKS